MTASLGPKADEPSDARSSTPSASIQTRERPRILCVDDDPMMLRSLAATLRKHFEVITASEGPAALEILACDAGIRVVISDYRMPTMSGAAFLARVRDRFPNPVRLLLTGAGAEGEDVTADVGLVFRILSKPCRRELMIRAIEEALARSREVAASADDH